MSEVVCAIRSCGSWILPVAIQAGSKSSNRRPAEVLPGVYWGPNVTNSAHHQSWISSMRRRAPIAALALVVVFAPTIVAAQSAKAPTYKEAVLYKFCSLTDCADGLFPYSDLLRDAEGNVSGTPSQGG